MFCVENTLRLRGCLDIINPWHRRHRWSDLGGRDERAVLEQADLSSAAGCCILTKRISIGRDEDACQAIILHLTVDKRIVVFSLCSLKKTLCVCGSWMSLPILNCW
jgi:hypothetical protein